MRIEEVLKTGKNILAKNDIEVSEARLILSFVLGVDKEKLVMINEVNDKDFGKYLTLLEKRVKGEPYAYIVRPSTIYEVRFYSKS